ncbi:hypothetical protein H4R18_000774 [Coemansia javaensis]|uniref:Aldehyde dehydrogenase domain-containing protein n=1 Tax=Coemansia javaensis TaxID=2761396 RepID=A0A9W8HLR8_9FUNG|nr:hypothetical protein H4R18_000774 [Coemansia javaensis]
MRSLLLGYLAGAAAFAVAGASGGAHAIDNCNRAYWRQKMVGTLLVDRDHMAGARGSERRLSNFEAVPEPKRILGPHTEVREKIVDPWRLTVMVDAHNVVVDFVHQGMSTGHSGWITVGVAAAVVACAAIAVLGARSLRADHERALRLRSARKKYRELLRELSACKDVLGIVDAGLMPGAQQAAMASEEVLRLMQRIDGVEPAQVLVAAGLDPWAEHEEQSRAAAARGGLAAALEMAGDVRAIRKSLIRKAERRARRLDALATATIAADGHAGLTMAATAISELPFNKDRIYINDQWVASAGSETCRVENPDTGEELATVPECTGDDVDRAVRAAHAAFYDGPWVNEWSGAQRRDALSGLADAIEAHRGEIEVLESLNTGKPITDVRAELDDTIDLFRHFAGFADKVQGRHIAPQANGAFEGYTVKVPVGVVGFINAFNYPICLLAWKVAPALAAGCTVVFKPGPQTPLTTQYFAHLVHTTGLFPPGVFNVVLGGATVGQALVDHDLVDKIGFTGSVATGKHVIRSTASTRMVRATSVELGGKSPGVVMPDADLDKTARLVVSGCMANAGMNCNALTRLWVHRDVYDAFLPRLKAAAEALRLGTPQDDATEMGPLIDRRQYERVLEYIRVGRDEDRAQLLTGGQPALLGRGYWIQPTVFANVDPAARVATEEIFGPVLSVLRPFDSLDEVIAAERRSDFGLAASIFSRNHQAIAQFTRRMRCGTIWVNAHNPLFSYLPFGGFRNSGFGRELGYESFDGYLATKAIIDDITY